MTTKEHIEAYQIGQNSYNFLLDIAVSIQQKMIECSRKNVETFNANLPERKVFDYTKFTNFNHNNSGYISDIVFNEDNTVTITEENASSGDVWIKEETVSLELFTSDKQKRDEMICADSDMRYNKYVETVNRRKEEARLQNVACERAEYERLKSKFEGVGASVQRVKSIDFGREV